MGKNTSNKPALFLICIVILIVIAVPIAGIFIISDGHPYDMYVINKAAAAHLQNNGYSEDDLLEAHYVHKSNLDNANYCEGQYMVVFKDEPDIAYYYSVSKENHNVVQVAEKDCTLEDGSCKIITDATKHTEEHCIRSDSSSHH